MNRVRWLRVGASAVFAAASAYGAGAQVACTVTVTGQNDPAVDAAAVRDATNQAFVGDLTVCLQGTFDFAPPVPPAQISVIVLASPGTTALHIVGLDNPNGKKATIRNGRQALGFWRQRPSSIQATRSIRRSRRRFDRRASRTRS